MVAVDNGVNVAGVVAADETREIGDRPTVEEPSAGPSDGKSDCDKLR